MYMNNNLKLRLVAVRGNLALLAQADYKNAYLVVRNLNLNEDKVSWLEATDFSEKNDRMAVVTFSKYSVGTRNGVFGIVRRK